MASAGSWKDRDGNGTIGGRSTPLAKVTGNGAEQLPLASACRHRHHPGCLVRRVANNTRAFSEVVRLFFWRSASTPANAAELPTDVDASGPHWSRRLPGCCFLVRATR